MLDSLLASVVAREQGADAGFVATLQPTEIVIPVAKSECGRYHLASAAEYEWEERESTWVNRPSPVAAAQLFGSSKVRIETSAGLSKPWRLPIATGWVKGDLLTWWCVGDADEIERLLRMVTHLGKRAAVGKGEVAEWTVQQCETWAGYPVLRGGYPLRPLPTDTPGLAEDAYIADGRLTYPYWMQQGRDWVALPEPQW
jgi:CRISPR type IV-associated protein Csf3